MPLLINAKIGNAKFSFLVDTGASISVLPLRCVPDYRLRNSNINVSNASGTSIKVYGEVDVEVAIPSIRRTFNWTFLVADVVGPILGVDFLARHALLVDCSTRQLIDSSTNRRVPLKPSVDVAPVYQINTHNIHSVAANILEKFPNLTSPLQISDNDKFQTSIEHTIETGNQSPVYCRPRPLSGNKLLAAREEFQYMLNAGIIRRSNSPWASPLHLVPKKEPNTWRPCGDYRRLNNITVDDKYPLPHLRSLTRSFHGKRLFTKIDLQKAYLQIPVSPQDIPKTAVATPFGLFEFVKMPFGLKNAGATFQRYIDSLLGHVECVYSYLDDLIIASSDETQHLNDVENVLSILSDNNLKISLDKCEFFKDDLIFLGYHITTDGVKPPAHKVDIIVNYPLPQSSTELRSFMGMINFFRPMIPSFATIAYGVSEMLRANPNSKQLEWNDSAITSFKNLKQALADSPTLSFPSTECNEYQLVSDSSGFAVGSALYQMIDGKPHPVGFYSKKLTDVQRTYSTYDRELLSAYLSILHFKSIIDGHPVTLFTDHKPIVSAFYSKNISKSDRQQRQLSYISEYVSSLQYICGNNNVVADCLSRPINAVTVDAFDLSGIAKSQVDDPEFLVYQPKLSEFILPSANLPIFCDTSTPSPRPFVPINLRSSIIESLHKLAHPGCKATSKIVKQRYYWPNIDHDVREYVRNCENCQSAKTQRHTKSQVVTIAPQSDRFQTVHIDIVGPLPTAYCTDHNYPLPYRYLLTCIDRATRWTEAIPLIDTTASSVALAFVSGWISRLGVPLEVVTDRGPQFESELFNNISSIIGFHHIRTTSYHPQANGIIERFHRTLKSSIMARKDNWFISLPIVMLGLRMIPGETGFSPFTAVTGTVMLCPHPIICKDYVSVSSSETVKTLVREMQSIDFSNNSSGIIKSSPKPFVPSDLVKCPKVWLRVDRIRKSLEAPYSGPFDVISRNDKFFKLKLPQGDTTVSIDRLKPAYLKDNNVSNGSMSRDSISNDSISNDVISNDVAHPVSPGTLTPNDVGSNVGEDVSVNTEPIAPPIVIPDNIRTTRSGRTVRFNANPDHVYY